MSHNNQILEDLLNKLLRDKDKDKKCDEIKDLLKKLPPNYPVGGVFFKGTAVPVAFFSNLCDCLAYFIDADGQVRVFDATKITGLAFGEEVDIGE